MTLREEKGSKLTAAELDGNFLHTMEVMGEMEQQIMASMSYIYNIVLNFGPTVVRKTITSEEIKNSFTTPVEIAPAQEGYVYSNISGFFRMVNGTNSFTKQNHSFLITYDGYETEPYHVTSQSLDNISGDWISLRSESQFKLELPVYSNRSLVLFTPTDISSDPGDYDMELILSVQVIQTFPFF